MGKHRSGNFTFVILYGSWFLKPLQSSSAIEIREFHLNNQQGMLQILLNTWSSLNYQTNLLRVSALVRFSAPLLVIFVSSPQVVLHLLQFYNLQFNLVIPLIVFYIIRFAYICWSIGICCGMCCNCSINFCFFGLTFIAWILLLLVLASFGLVILEFCCCFVDVLLTI